MTQVNQTNTEAQNTQTALTATTTSLPMNSRQSGAPLSIDAANSLVNPTSPQVGNDVYSQTYLWLKAMQSDPQNTNNAEFFTLYLSNLTNAAANGQYDSDEFSAFADNLISVQTSVKLPFGLETAKGNATVNLNIVQAAVAVTMTQMILSGTSKSDAVQQINTLFPSSQTDVISQAAQQTANVFANYPNNVSKTNFDQSAYQSSELYKVKQMPAGSNKSNASELLLEKQWFNYMTNPTLAASINSDKADIRTSMLEDIGSENIYLAVIELLLLLEAAGVISMDAYGDVSNDLTGETNELNQLMSEWSTPGYFDPSSPDGKQNAINFMNQARELQMNVNETFMGSTDLSSINQKFSNIGVLPAITVNQLGYVDDQGRPVAGASTYPGVTIATDDNNNPKFTVQPYNVPASQGGNIPGGSSPVRDGSPVYEGQAVDSEGRPLYELDGVNTGESATVYLGTDGNFYFEDSGGMADSKSGDGTPVAYPLYWTDDPAAEGHLTASNNLTTNQNGRPNPNLTSPLTVTPVNVDNDVYINSSGTTISVSPDGQAPAGATVSSDGTTYTDNNGNTVYLTPPSGYTQVTLGDQGKNPGDGTALATSLNYYQEDPPVDQGLSSTGGVDVGGPRDGAEDFLNLDDGLSTALSQQSATIGTQISQETSSIELYDNTFSGIVLNDTNGMLASEQTVSNNWKG